MKKDIFISYPNDGVGNNFASRLANNLKESGYSVYFNSNEKRLGSFPDRLKKAIYDCYDFICIVTDSYIARLISNEKICWIRDELLYARELDKNIIPLLVNGAEMPQDASELPENLSFFPSTDAYVFPEQYISSPYSELCSVLTSRHDGSSGFRDIYNSNEQFDPDKTLENVLVKAGDGDDCSMITAGVYYYYGIAGGKDERKAAEWFKKVSANEGQYAPIADKLIARMYYAGSMPREPQSYENSYKYHTKSAKGDIYSAGQVGFMRTIGSGCCFNYDDVEAYYLPILDKLDNPLKDTLCRFYMDYGEFKKAAAIYEGMAETYPNAAYQLGLMYKRGVLNTPFMPDYEKAAMYFQMALDNGHRDAAYDLGCLYFNPTGNFPKNFAKAQSLFRKAARKGNVKAQYMLGYMYYYGHVEKNYKKAIHYFELAAKRGDVLSAENLALLYQIPEIHNYERALKYCKYAADCGDTRALFILGTMYLSGRGCEPDTDKAYLCFKDAAGNGTPEAEFLLRQMEELGI